MVCAKCEKKLAKAGVSQMAATSVWDKPGTSAAGGRKVGENKLLSSKARYSPYAPAAAGAAGDKKGKGKATGATDLAGGSGGAVARCEVCRSVTARPGAKYCQGCAYKKGACAMCGKQILDTSGYKMSSK
ncbi:hypothetical protein JCM3775_003409 [Rhodotorula graminis]